MKLRTADEWATVKKKYKRVVDYGEVNYVAKKV